MKWNRFLIVLDNFLRNLFSKAEESSPARAVHKSIMIYFNSIFFLDVISLFKHQKSIESLYEKNKISVKWNNKIITVTLWRHTSIFRSVLKIMVWQFTKWICKHQRIMTVGKWKLYKLLSFCINFATNCIKGLMI